MTLRTTSATRRTVVSRSSDVASTSATSSRSDSTGSFPGFVRTEPIVFMITAPRSGTLKGPPDQPQPGTLFTRHHTNVGEIAILLRVIQTVAYHKLVGNLEAHVVALQRQLAPRR